MQQPPVYSVPRPQRKRFHRNKHPARRPHNLLPAANIPLGFGESRDSHAHPVPPPAEDERPILPVQRGNHGRNEERGDGMAIDGAGMAFVNDEMQNEIKLEPL